jgi:surface protein
MKSDLWSIGILIYYMFYNEYPFIERFYFDIIKNEIQLEKLPLDDDLKFLLENLIKKDINKRLSWEEYFSNPLFQNNYFTCEYKISKDDLKEPIQIINCFDKEKKDYVNVDSKFNDREILEHCELYINNKKIDFCFKFKFPEEGNYTIKIVCEQPLSNTSFLFYNCKNLISIDLSNFNTNFVEDMKFMFGNCISLTELDLSNFNTKNVINMGRMFINCSSLNYLDITKFNTKKVKYMYSMFSGCCSLTDINLESFKTDNVIDMGEMFNGCSLLKELNLNNFKTPKVEKMNLMFYRCEFLSSLNINGFQVSNKTDLTDMFKEMNKNCIVNVSNNEIKKYIN